LVGLHRKTDWCRSNFGEGARRRRGGSEGKGSGAHDDQGVAGVGEERDRGGVSTANRAGGGAPRDVDRVPVAGGQENSGEVARQLLRDDMVLVGCLAGAKRRWIDGRTARLSGGGSSSSPA
jgi:hypothetical protein